jgi:hypothetical protein
MSVDVAEFLEFLRDHAAAPVAQQDSRCAQPGQRETVGARHVV